MKFNLRKGWGKTSAPAKASIVFMAANFFHEGVQFITVPIYTRLLSTTDYGVTAIYNSWEALLGVFAMLSLSAATFNNGMFEFKSDRDTYTSSILALSNTSTLILFLIYLITKPIFGPYIGLPDVLMLLMFLCFIFRPAYMFWMARQRYEFKYRASAAVMTLNSLLSPLLGIFMVLYIDGDKAVIKLWGSKIVFLGICMFFYVYSFTKSHFQIKKQYYFYALALTLPLIPHYLSQNILHSSDRIMIAMFVNEASAGIYSLAYSAALAVKVVWSSINATLLPWTYEKMGEKSYESIYKNTRILISGYALLCIGIMITAPEIISILAPKSYHEGVYVIPPIIAGVFFTGIYDLLACIEFFHKKTRMIMFATLIAALLNVVLNWVFIPVFGYTAAAYTTLFCYMVYAALHYLNVRRIEKNKVCDIRVITALSMLIIIASVVAPHLYDFPFLRYSLVFIISIIVFVTRKKILDIIKAIKKKGA